MSVACYNPQITCIDHHKAIKRSRWSNLRCGLGKLARIYPLTTCFDIRGLIFSILLGSVISGCGGGGSSSGIQSVASGTIPDDAKTGIAILSWVPPTTNADATALQDLAGYKIYYGKTEGGYTEHLDVNNPGVASYVVENLPGGLMYFVVTAYDISGNESEYSNVANKVIK